MIVKLLTRANWRDILFIKGVNLMPLKNSTVISVRIKNETASEINRRIKRRGITKNKWLNWVVGLGLRTHKKKSR